MRRQKLSSSKSRYKQSLGTDHSGGLSKHSANVIMNNRLL